jgi:carboxymethylenebutenolidase
MPGRDVVLPAPPGGAATPAFAATPNGARRGVVVIHEIFGRAPEIDRVVERFERMGYAAVAPDLFADGMKVMCIRRAVVDLWRGAGPTLDKVIAARDWLTAETGIPSDRIGIIGFCFGGSFALALGGDFGVVSTNYGEIPRNLLPEGMAPTIGCYGGRDHSMASVPGRLGKLLQERGVPHQLHLDPNAGHSYLTDGDRPILAALTRPLMHVEFNAERAEAAWSKIEAFFGEHLPA